MSHRFQRGALALAAAFVCQAPAWALTLDASQATVVSGIGSVSTSGTTTTVTQGSAVLRLNWTSLDVPTGHTLAFAQGSATQVAVNVVTGSTGSQVLGTVTAPGSVYWINPNGLFIAKGARVDVGSFVGSALGLSMLEPATGKVVLKSTGTAGVVTNEGEIVTSTGGTVALVGRQVTNSGLLSAPEGQALMLAGDRVVFKPNGESALSYVLDKAAVDALVQQSGTVSAQGGTVVLDARSLQQAVVNTSGVLEAGSIEAGTQGVIRLVALGAPGSQIDVQGQLRAGDLETAERSAMPVSAELAEGGVLRWQAAIEGAGKNWGEYFVEAQAMDKVYDGNDIASLRFDLRGLPSNVPTAIEVVKARFDASFVSDETDPRWDVTTEIRASLDGEGFIMAAPRESDDGRVLAAILPKALDVLVKTKVVDGTRTAELIDIDRSQLIAGDNVDPLRVEAILFDSAEASAEHIRVQFRGLTFSGSESGNYTFALLPEGAATSLSPGPVFVTSGRIVPAAVVPETPTTPTTPSTPTVPGTVIGNVQNGGQPTGLGANLAGLSDLLSRFPATAAGEEEDPDLIGTVRLSGNSPLQVKDGGVRVPATLR
jgi:filamentous hemagglutinin family protein